MAYVPYQTPIVAQKSAIELDPKKLIPYELASNSIILDYVPLDIEAPITFATLNSPFATRVIVLEQTVIEVIGWPQ